MNETEHYVVAFGPEEGQPTSFHADRPGRIKRFYGPKELTEAILLVETSNEVRGRGGKWNVYGYDGFQYTRVVPQQKREPQYIISLADVEWPYDLAPDTS